MIIARMSAVCNLFCRQVVKEELHRLDVNHLQISMSDSFGSKHPYKPAVGQIRPALNILRMAEIVRHRRIIFSRSGSADTRMRHRKLLRWILCIAQKNRIFLLRAEDI